MFKDIFSDILQSNNITAAKLSQETGISEGLISQWKSGRQLPKYDSIKILCDYFDVSADYLLERDTKNTLIMTNVHDNFSVATQTSAPVTISGTDSLSAQERDLLQIFRNANGKKQVEIMQFIYGMEKTK